MRVPGERKGTWTDTSNWKGLQEIKENLNTDENQGNEPATFSVHAAFHKKEAALLEYTKAALEKRAHSEFH